MASIGLFRRMIEAVLSCVFTPKSTITKDNNEFDLSTDDNHRRCDGMFISADGLKMYQLSDLPWPTTDGDNGILEYTMSTAFDLSTMTYNRTLDITTDITVSGTQRIPTYVFFSEDGLNMYASHFDYLFHWDLSTAWNISTATLNYSEVNDDIYTGLGYISHCVFNDTGTEAIINDNSDGYEHLSFTTAYDFTTATHNTAKSGAKPSTNYGFERNSPLVCGGKGFVSVDDANTYFYTFDTEFDASAWTLEQSPSYAMVGASSEFLDTLYKCQYVNNYLYCMGDDTGGSGASFPTANARIERFS